MTAVTERTELQHQLRDLRLDDRAATSDLRTLDRNLRKVLRDLAGQKKKLAAAQRRVEREANTLRQRTVARREKIARRIAIFAGRLS